eukprot:3765097-Prymnesium_polylepis.1
MGAHAVTNLAIQHPSLLAAAVAVSAPTGLGTNPAAQFGLSGVCGQPARLFPRWLFACLGLESECVYPHARRWGIACGLFTLVPHPDSYRREDAARAKNVPLWLVHGDADTLIFSDSSRALAGALRAAGSKATYLTMFPGHGHFSIPRLVYSSPQVYEWLFAH